MKLTRKNFELWLKNLPPRKRVGTKNLCPIWFAEQRAPFLQHGRYGEWVSHFMGAVDSIWGYGQWDSITAKRALQILKDIP